MKSTIYTQFQGYLINFSVVIFPCKSYNHNAPGEIGLGAPKSSSHRTYTFTHARSIRLSITTTHHWRPIHTYICVDVYAMKKRPNDAILNEAKMLYCVLRLNQKTGQWSAPVRFDLTQPDSFLTDDKEWIEKFMKDMTWCYPTEVYCIAEVHPPKDYSYVVPVKF